MPIIASDPSARSGYEPGLVAESIITYLEGDARKMDASVLAEAVGRFKRTIMKQLMKPREDRKGYESNSLYSGPCARKARFTYDGAAREPIQARTILKFLLGDAVELTTLLLGRLAGLEIGWNNEDLTVTGRDHTLVPVHPDGLLQAGQYYNVEVKSCDSRTFDRWLANGGPDNDWGYLTQASVEIAAWRESGLTVDATNFIATSTGSRIGSIADWLIPFDQLLVDAWHDRRALVHEKEMPPIPFVPVAEMQYVQGAMMPGHDQAVPRENKNGRVYGWDVPTGRQILPFQCTYCDYKLEDWKGAVMELDGNRPVWVVPSGGSEIPPHDPAVTLISRPLHPDTHCGSIDWSAWILDVMEHHQEAFKYVQKATGVFMPGDYESMTPEQRSEFRYSMDDRIKLLASGREVKKKRGKRK